MGDISNYVSYAISMIEVTLLSGCVWGFSFMQSVFEREYVYYDEKCQDDCIKACGLAESDMCTWNSTLCEDREICTSIKETYSSIFAIFSVTASISGLVFEPVGRLSGPIGVRTLMCLLSTVGACMLIFFDDNPDLIMISWNLMGFPTFIYLTANIDEQCARFPAIGHFTIALLNGFYNVSSGMFLIVNKLHEKNVFSVESMLAFFAGLHVIPIVKTFCLTPRNGVTEKSAFATSPLGWILGRDRKTDEEKEYEDFEREEKEQRNKVPPLMTSLLSADYLVSSVFFIIMNVRAVSFPGWSFNWFQWHFRDSPTKVEDVNFCMDIFGYTFFMSLAFAFIPQMIISFYAYTSRNAQLASEKGLLAVMVITAVFTTVFSFQMMMETASMVNAITLTIFFALVRTLYYIGKSMYYFEHFPAEHFSALYLINTIPCGLANFVTDPIYKYWVLPKEGDDSDEENWQAVSFWLAIVWTASNVLFLLYHCLISLPRKHKLEAEKKALEDPDNWEIIPQDNKQDGSLVSSSSGDASSQRKLTTDSL